jgi:hypothetical protein
MLFASSWFLAKYNMASASSLKSTLAINFPFPSSPTTSVAPPAFNATTGFSEAIASSSVILKPSRYDDDEKGHMHHTFAVRFF